MDRFIITEASIQCNTIYEECDSSLKTGSDADDGCPAVHLEPVL